MTGDGRPGRRKSDRNCKGNRKIRELIVGDEVGKVRFSSRVLWIRYKGNSSVETNGDGRESEGKQGKRATIRTESVSMIGFRPGY